MARGSIVKRKSGNYAIVYYVGGKQRWETIGPSRREAERALTARKREVDTGTWREPSSETLASYAERWLAHRDPARVGGGGRTRLSPSTFEGYRLNLRRHVLPRLGDRTLSSLRTEDVDRLIAELEADGKAAGTVRNVIVPLRKLLGDAVRQGLLLANPAARADLPPAQDFAGKEIPLAHTDAMRHSLVRAGAARSASARAGPLLRLPLRRCARHGSSPRRAPSAAMARRRPRAPADPSRARLLAPGGTATEDRVWRPLRSALSVGRRGFPGAGCASRRAGPLRARGARLRLEARHAASTVELTPARLGPGAQACPPRGRGLPVPRPPAHVRLAACRCRRRREARPGCRWPCEPAHHAKRYSHLLDARVTEAATRFDPARGPLEAR